MQYVPQTGSGASKGPVSAQGARRPARRRDKEGEGQSEGRGLGEGCEHEAFNHLRGFLRLCLRFDIFASDQRAQPRVLK